MRGRLVGGLTIAVVVLVARQAGAAAFYIQEQSVAGTGRAYAGESAVADTPATIFFNPAGLTYLERPQVMGAGYAILPDASFDDRGTTARTPATFGAFRRVGGNDGGNPYGPTALGNFYASMPVVPGRLWLGLGATAPYGLLVVYNSTWFGRYDSTKSRLVTFNFAPTAAVRATDWLSLGVSLNIEHAYALLRSALPNATTPGGPTAKRSCPSGTPAWRRAAFASARRRRSPSASRCGTACRSTSTSRCRPRATVHSPPS